MKHVTSDDVQRVATWPLVIEALRDGHRGAEAPVGDTLLHSGERKLLVRSAWVEGVGPGLKAVTVCPGNPNLPGNPPSVQGLVVLFDDATGAVDALVDGVALTGWKTAGDSALGADLLARPDAGRMLMVGAGAMAGPLVRAHLSVRPSIRVVQVWNRSRERAEALAESLSDLNAEVGVADDLDAGVAEADLISSATMSETPLIKGALLKPGAHLDLVGAYTPAMREADDEALRRSRIFVDCYGTTLDHIGELLIPLRAGTIQRGDVAGDLYGLVGGGVQGRASPDQVTLFKNGGGAHLDVMVARALVEQASK